MRSRHRVAKHSGFSELPCPDYNQPLADRAMILNRNFLYRMILSPASNIHTFKAVGLNPNLEPNSGYLLDLILIVLVAGDRLISSIIVPCRVLRVSNTTLATSSGKIALLSRSPGSKFN